MGKEDWEPFAKNVSRGKKPGDTPLVRITDQGKMILNAKATQDFNLFPPGKGREADHWRFVRFYYNKKANQIGIEHVRRRPPDTHKDPILTVTRARSGDKERNSSAIISIRSFLNDFNLLSKQDATYSIKMEKSPLGSGQHWLVVDLTIKR